MSEEQEDPIAKKKRKQHEAWRRWYAGEGGRRYRERKRKTPRPSPETEAK